MESEDDIKMRFEFITNKVQVLDISKEYKENASNGFKSSEINIQQIEKCEKNEAIEEFIGGKTDVELVTEKENKEVTNEGKAVDSIIEQDYQENIEEAYVEITKEIEDDCFLCKKEVEDVANGRNYSESTCEKEDVELTVQTVDSNSTDEKDFTENEKRERFKEHAKLTIENAPTRGKDYTEKREILKENCQSDEILFEEIILDHKGINYSVGEKRTQYEKRETVVCTECASDSKISTSSTEIATSSSSGSKSGIRIEDQNFKESFRIPSDALVAKIIRQAEFYFSDFNLLKNNFLLKHVRRNKEGYVSLKLVASFRKIKSLTKDWRVVAYSLKSSKLLELNSETSKIRRIEPIPKVEETSLGKTVVVFNLPHQNPTSEELKEMFSKFGNIVRAEIMSPKSANYNTYYKRCRYHNEEIASTIFGSIEFEKYEDAVSAIKDEESHLPKENRMKVVALMPNIQRPKRRNSRFNQYNQYPQRGNERFNSRYEFQNDQMVNGAHYDDYRYARPLMNEKQYRRFYREGYQKAIHPSGSASEIPNKLLRDKYVESGEDVRNSSYARSRQLQMSNRMNINRQFSTRQPRYVDGNFGYRETNFEG